MSIAEYPAVTWPQPPRSHRAPRLTLREHVGTDPALRAALSVAKGGDATSGFGFLLGAAGAALSAVLLAIAWFTGSPRLGFVGMSVLVVLAAATGAVIGLGAGRNQGARALAAGCNPLIREAIAADIADTYGLMVRPGSLPLLPHETQETGATTGDGLRVPVRIEFTDVDEPITLTRLPVIKG